MTKGTKKPLKKGEKIYRVMYRVRLGNYPLVGEFNVKTTKEKWEIDFEELASKFIKLHSSEIIFDEVIDSQVIS